MLLLLGLLLSLQASAGFAGQERLHRKQLSYAFHGSHAFWLQDQDLAVAGSRDDWQQRIIAAQAPAAEGSKNGLYALAKSSTPSSRRSTLAPASNNATTMRVSAYGLSLRMQAALAWPDTCPDWLKQYAAQHQQLLIQHNLSSASNASNAKQQNQSSGTSTTKFMMHDCLGKETQIGCPGLGDRVRGLQETLRLAVHAKRAFLVRWEASGPLEDVLQPALIDWRVQPQYNIDSIQDKQQYSWHAFMPRPAEVTNGAFAAKTSRLLTMTHGDQDCKHMLPGPDIGCNDEIPSALRSCVFHALFKPSDQLASNVASLRKQLFGSETRPYLAVHLRIGGFEGERNVVRGGLSFSNTSATEVIAATLRAARELADASGITAPVLVLTDNDALRTELQQGQLPGFISTPFLAKHASRFSGAAHHEALMTSFADLALLAQARCFIGSPSGFTWTALMWGRHECFLMVNGDGKGGVGQSKLG